MKLYPKKLSGVEELKREKRMLQRAKDELESEGFFSSASKGEGGGDWKDALLGNFGTIAEFLPLSGLGGDLLKRFVSRIIRRKNRKEEREAAPEKEETHSDSLLKKAAVEILGGYLKWKAIELTYKGIMHLVKGKKKEEE